MTKAIASFTGIFWIIHVILNFNSNPSALYEISSIYIYIVDPAFYKHKWFSPIKTKIG